MTSQTTSAEDRKKRRAAATRRYYAKNREKVKENVKRWCERNPDRVSVNKSRHYHSLPKSETKQLQLMSLKRCRTCKEVLHRDQFSPAGKGGKSRMPDCRGCRNKIISNDPTISVNRRIRSSLRAWLKGKGGLSSKEILGYGPAELIVHIERQFVDGMSWDNMKDWHIDHIVPLSSFVVDGPLDPTVRIAWALSNLRPLWASENLRKSDKRIFLI